MTSLKSIKLPLALTSLIVFSISLAGCGGMGSGSLQPTMSPTGGFISRINDGTSNTRRSAITRVTDGTSNTR